MNDEEPKDGSDAWMDEKDKVHLSQKYKEDKGVLPPEYLITQ